MDIQFAEEYKNAEKGENGAWVFEQSEPGLERGRTLGAGARERKDTWSRGSREEGHLEPGLERRSRSRGPELGRWSRESPFVPTTRVSGTKQNQVWPCRPVN